MLKTEVIAAHITNLTDARYFAAWGVSHICFDLPEGTWKSDADRMITEIIEWLEGPTYLARIRDKAINADRIAAMQSAGLKGVWVDAHAEVDSTDNAWQIFRQIPIDEKAAASLIGPNETLIFSADDPQEKEMEHWRTQKPFFLDAPIQTEMLTDILGYPNLAGIVLHGGTEERVGLKSFESLDDILERLLIE